MFVRDWSQDASVFAILELSALTVTLFSAVHPLTRVASGLVILAGSADGIFSSEVGCFRKKIAATFSLAETISTGCG